MKISKPVVAVLLASSIAKVSSAPIEKRDGQYAAPLVPIPGGLGVCNIAFGLKSLAGASNPDEKVITLAGAMTPAPSKSVLEAYADSFTSCMASYVEGGKFGTTKNCGVDGVQDCDIVNQNGTVVADQEVASAVNTGGTAKLFAFKGDGYDANVPAQAAAHTTCHKLAWDAANPALPSAGSRGTVPKTALAAALLSASLGAALLSA